MPFVLMRLPRQIIYTLLVVQIYLGYITVMMHKICKTDLPSIKYGAAYSAMHQIGYALAYHLNMDGKG